MHLNNLTNNLNHNTLTFGTTSRFYKDYKGDEVGTYSWLFRDDIDWHALVEYERQNFKDKEKVNIIQFAASDGSEAYTKLIAMEENGSPEFEKFYPIHAYDIDEEIIKAARSGLINCIPNDIKRLDNAGIKFKKYFWEAAGSLNIQNDRMYHLYGVPQITHEVNPKLQSRVLFNTADMFDIVKRIEDDSNTIVMARNVMLYLQEDEIKSFINILSNKLKPGSLFITGKLDHDKSRINEYLQNGGFIKIMNNVYKKQHQPN